jgi:hypothetical protein
MKADPASAHCCRAPRGCRFSLPAVRFRGFKLLKDRRRWSYRRRARTRCERGHPMSLELTRNRYSHCRGVRAAQEQVLLASCPHNEHLLFPGTTVRLSIVRNSQYPFGGVQVGRTQLVCSQHGHLPRLLSRNSRFFSSQSCFFIRHPRYSSRHSRESGIPPRQDLRTFEQKRSTGLCIIPATAGIHRRRLSSSPTTCDLPDCL